MQFHWKVMTLVKFQMPAKIHKNAANIPPMRATHSIHAGARIEVSMCGRKIDVLINFDAIYGLSFILNKLW